MIIGTWGQGEGGKKKNVVVIHLIMKAYANNPF